MNLSTPAATRPHRIALLLLLAAIGLAAALGLLLALAPAAAAHTQTAALNEPHAPLAVEGLFQANLSGAHEVPAVDSRAAGRAVLALSDDLTTLYYRVLVHDIDDITMAHIHAAAAGVNGPVVHWLYDANGVNGPGGDFDPDNPISGMLTLTSDDVDDLLAGDYYINVHTTSYPGGEIRGQITPLAPGATYNALLEGRHEVPAASTNALGITRFTLGEDYAFDYELGVTDIENVTMAHIHRGAAGANGPVVHWLFDPSGVQAPGGTLDAGNSISGTVTLGARDLVDLLTGYFYVNVHTQAYPGGEIRGQIGGVNVFEAAQNGAHEVPRVLTRASSKVILALAADASTLYYRMLVRDLPNITVAHIHRGAFGVNGPPVHWLYDASGNQGPSGAFDDANPVAGSVTLSDADVYDLLRGNFYINIHTTAYPAGEVRGQIRWHNTPTHFNALLSGREEVPAVSTAAVGATRFTYDGALDLMHYNIVVRDLISATAAHIHTGWPGVNGPVVHWLYHEPGVNAPGGPWDVDNPVAGALPMNAQHMVDLLTGYYYVNAHSQAYPAGEMRGQVDGVQTFQARLSGTQEAPPVGTFASGRAVFGLSADTSTLYYRIQVKDISGVTMSHIHRAPAGTNGPVVHWLFDPAGVQAPGGTLDADNPVSGSRPFGTADLLDLTAGRFYVNVHTGAYPAGELRGQIWPYWAATHYQAGLSGANEVPPVSTSGSGGAYLTLYPGMDALHFYITVANLPLITMAHIHTGWPGVNGPVVHWLYHETGANAPGGPWDETNPIGGCLKFNAQHMVDLLTGYYYVNVHTTTYPGGEIRGQLGPVHRLYLPLKLQS